jgi:hypothetical protein
MTDDAQDAMTRSDDEIEQTSAPIDFDRLDLMWERFHRNDRFTRSEWRPEYAPNKVIFHYNPGYYPMIVTDARLEIVWFENDDFFIHYHETHDDDSFDHRWDRHPSEHNTRDHLHPGPDAPTPGTVTSHPSDWRDVLSMVITEIEDRQRAFWAP